MAAHILSGVGPGPGRLGWAYAATLGFGLVYLGEHYVMDLAVGLLLTEVIRAAAPAAAPLFRSVAHGVQRLEPRTA